MSVSGALAAVPRVPAGPVAETGGAIPDFRSDNVSPVCPEIFAALQAENSGTAPAYGEDGVSRQLNALFSDLFECRVTVFPTITGTASNALALSSVAAPYTSVICHEEAHVALDEAGAPEFYGALRLVPVAGSRGKIAPLSVSETLAVRPSSGALRYAALSIGQATESGSVYTPDEIGALARVARLNGMAVHMDGARFANAVAALGCRPSEISGAAGVDILSFGATKNGALAAEAVIFFDEGRARDFAQRRKRGGHTISKMRFLSAQLAAYIGQGLWLRNAAHANAQAARLARGLSQLPGVELAEPVEANQIFVRFPELVLNRLAAGNIHLHRWGPEGSNLVRLVTAFDTSESDIAAFLDALRRFGLQEETKA